MAQTNDLSDNDVAVQVSSDSHYNLVGGHNQLTNLALIIDGNVHYDLIIIQGNYHGMNVIFQNNILLNNDNIVMSADGADPSQSVRSGHNRLSNEGSIENYGGDNFDDLTAGFRIIESLLAAGMTSIDPELGSPSPAMADRCAYSTPPETITTSMRFGRPTSPPTST